MVLPPASPGGAAHPPGTAGLIPQFEDGAGPLVDDPGRDEVEIAGAVHHFGSLDGERIAIPDVRANLLQVPGWAKDHRVGVAGAFKGEGSWT
jgi:hypothetical protein